MKLVIIPPYKLVGVTYHTRKEGQLVVREIVDNMAKKGQLEGVEIDIAEGYPRENPAEARDEELCDEIAPGLQNAAADRFDDILGIKHNENAAKKD